MITTTATTATTATTTAIVRKSLDSRAQPVATEHAKPSSTQFSILSFVIGMCKLKLPSLHVTIYSHSPSVHFDMTVPTQAGSTSSFCIKVCVNGAKEDNLDKTQYIRACPPTLVSHFAKNCRKFHAALIHSDECWLAYDGRSNYVLSGFVIYASLLQQSCLCMQLHAYISA